MVSTTGKIQANSFGSPEENKIISSCRYYCGRYRVGSHIQQCLLLGAGRSKGRQSGQHVLPLCFQSMYRYKFEKRREM